MKSEAVAAALFGVAQPFNRRIGERKIPPPTPITPLIKPIPPPMGKALETSGVVTAPSLRSCLV